MMSHWILREEREDRKTHRVTADADNHRRAPAEFFQSDAENRHRRNFRDLSDAHDRHDPVAGNANGFAAEKHAGPAKEAVVHEGIDERDEPEHQHERVLQQTACFQPGEFVSGRDRFLRRRMRQAPS